ncbi:MAG: hypothetical protein JWP91_2983 [Fibrobacteres bacterium]|nr:hypothetical protein [Fibrobacterota bacterium]
MHLYVPKGQSGFGLIETMTGLVVFMILAMVGTKAFHGVIANQKETAQVKALTDAVTVTAERLSALAVSTLTEAGSPYLAWSAPAEIGSGEYQYRFRTFPKPSIAGIPDTAVVGLEVEVGLVSGGAFTAGRQFATLIAPHLSSKNKLGQVSTQAERDAEASNYAMLKARIEAVGASSVAQNQVKLNSFNCYDPGQCCGFMDKFFADPGIRPEDGIDEKCLYRCAMTGSVHMTEWNSSCHTDFCAIAPWKSSDQCCAAIAAGECKPGSVCAQVCIECQHQDGSTCTPPEGVCDGGWWNDFFDCANGNFCDGTAIPGTVAGWGDVKTMCTNSACATIKSECQALTPTCCREYWGVINQGGTPNPHAEICSQISKASDCCMMPLEIWDWDQIQCGTNGKVITAHNKEDGKWYCGMTGSGWDHACAQYKGCSATYTPTGSGGTCGGWTGVWIDGPWMDTYPPPPQPVVTTTVTTGTATPSTGTTGSGTVTTSKPAIRIPSVRAGGKWGSWGGRE